MGCGSCSGVWGRGVGNIGYVMHQRLSVVDGVGKC